MTKYVEWVQAGQPAEPWHGGCGAKNSGAKLTEQQALSILNDPRDTAAIAASFDISSSAVNAIKRGRSWAYLKREGVQTSTTKRRVWPHKTASLRGEPMTLHLVLHVLRNPFGWAPGEQDLVRHWAADELERLSIAEALAAHKADQAGQ